MSMRFSSELANEQKRLSQVADPVEAVKQIGDFYADLEAGLKLVAEARLAAVKKLRADGWTYDRIAMETGLSRQRVAQLSHAVGMGGRAKGPR